jgi:hypothetical protein
MGPSNFVLYEPIVGFPTAIIVIGINLNTTILVNALVILCPCVKGIVVVLSTQVPSKAPF